MSAYWHDSATGASKPPNVFTEQKGGQGVTNRNLWRRWEYFLVLLMTGAVVGLAAGDSAAPLYAAGQQGVSQDVLEYGNYRQ